jgi:hypothetical protein
MPKFQGFSRVFPGFSKFFSPGFTFDESLLRAVYAPYKKRI